jgi:hypothetical protein
MLIHEGIVILGNIAGTIPIALLINNIQIDDKQTSNNVQINDQETPSDSSLNSSSDPSLNSSSDSSLNY